MSTQGGIGKFAWASGPVILLAEIYHSVVDREWMGYQFLQNFIFVEILSTIIVYALGKEKLEGVWGKLALYVEATGLIFGVFASISTGHAMSSCINLDQDTLDSATTCIKTYSSYAAVDGSMGINNVCANLDVNTESPLGGVCDNIVHGDAGTALLAIQFALVLILTALHLVKMRICHTSMKEGKEGKEGNSDNNTTGNTNDFNTNIAKPIGSIFGKKKYTTRRLMN